MANRSDLLSHLPRAERKALAMGRARGFIVDDQQLADIRNLLVKAHRTYKNYKLNRKAADPTQKATPASEKGEA